MAPWRDITPVSEPVLLLTETKCLFATFHYRGDLISNRGDINCTLITDMPGGLVTSVNVGAHENEISIAINDEICIVTSKYKLASIL